MAEHTLLSMSTAAPCSSSNLMISKCPCFTAKRSGVQPSYIWESSRRSHVTQWSTIALVPSQHLTWSCRLGWGAFSINTFRVLVWPPLLARWTADWPFCNVNTFHHGDQQIITWPHAGILPYFGSPELPHGLAAPWQSLLVHSHMPHPKQCYLPPPIIT